MGCKEGSSDSNVGGVGVRVGRTRVGEAVDEGDTEMVTTN
jgi:hypothetical protein